MQKTPHSKIQLEISGSREIGHDARLWRLVASRPPADDGRVTPRRDGTGEGYQGRRLPGGSELRPDLRHMTEAR